MNYDLALKNQDHFLNFKVKGHFDNFDYKK